MAIGHNVTISEFAPLSGTSETMKAYCWLRDQIVSRIKGQYISRANDCQCAIDSHTVNKFQPGIDEAKRARAAWQAKADAVWPHPPSERDLQALIAIERKQAELSTYIQDASNGLAESVRLEKPIQGKRCQETLDKLNPEASKLAAQWRKGMRAARIPITGDEKELAELGWLEPFKRALAATRGW